MTALDAPRRQRSISISVVVVAMLLAVTGSATAGQAAAVTRFEAAELTPHRPGDVTKGVRAQPGQLRLTDMSLREMIELAYGVPHPLGHVRISGDAAWLDSEHYDLVAKGRDGAPPSELLVALRALLADQFGLAVRHDTRELPVYALVIVRADRRLGPNLRLSTIDCTVRQPRPTAPPEPGTAPPCVVLHLPGRIAGTGLSLATFVTNGLARVVDDRVIVDRTGLTGAFDITLDFVPPPGATGRFAPASDSAGPSIFTALQEQLGLKLDAQRGAVDVVVVDRITRTSN